MPLAERTALHNEDQKEIEFRKYNPGKGELVQVFGYSVQDAYARIERATTTDVNEMLVSAGDGYISVNLGNTLPIY